MATERLLVQESIHDRFIELLLVAAAEPRLGDPMEVGTTYGPVNNETVAAQTVAIAIRRLRQDKIGEQLKTPLTASETEWLDADLG